MSKHSSNLLIDEYPLQVIPSLACKVGLNRAMFLQQLHYWLQKPEAHEKDGKRWVFNTYNEWHEQFPFWTPEAIRKIVSYLEEAGIVRTTDRYNARKGDRTKWYTIDYDALNALLVAEKHLDKSTEQPDKSTEQPENLPVLEADKSTERYHRLPETNNRDSRRDAAASPEAPKEPISTETPKEQPTNYMTIFSEAAKLLNYTITSEDRKDLPKNLKRVAAESDDSQMREIVRRCLIARSERSYPLSPQRAKREIESRASSNSRASPSHSIAVIGAKEEDYDIEEYRFHG